MSTKDEYGHTKAIELNPSFEAEFGNARFSILCKTGNLTWDLMNENVLELLGSTKRG